MALFAGCFGSLTDSGNSQPTAGREGDAQALTKQPLMQHPTGHERERACNQDATDLNADHVAAMGADVAAADAANGQWNAGQHQEAEEVDEAEVVQDARPHLGGHGQRDQGGEEDQHRVDAVEQLVNGRALDSLRPVSLGDGCRRERNNDGVRISKVRIPLGARERAEPTEPVWSERVASCLGPSGG